LLVVGLVAGSVSLAISDDVRSIIRDGVIAATIGQAGLWLSAALDIVVERYRREKPDSEERMTLSVRSLLARLAVWVKVTLLTLDNLGVDVTALVAGVGIAGARGSEHSRGPLRFAFHRARQTVRPWRLRRCWRTIGFGRARRH